LSMQRPEKPESGNTIAITVQGICTSARSGDANILPRRIETWSRNQVLVTVIATLTGALGVLLQLVDLWKSWRSKA
jgi:hypothetical protein